MFPKESPSRAVTLKDMQHELEQLTKELRQVNLQQFIKQTGTKVTVLPAEPAEDESTHNSHGIGNMILMESLIECILFHSSNNLLELKIQLMLQGKLQIQ